MKGNKKSIITGVLLLVIGITAGFVASTYAKYTDQVGGDGSASVARWAFGEDNDISSLTINLDQTPDPSTLVANKIAPGTSGSFAISLVNTNTETGVDFTLSLGSVTNVPANLKFYKDSNYTTEIVPGSTKVTGQLAAGDSTGVDVKIYWKWEYETTNGDAADTSDGEAARSLTIPVTITGVQTAPSSTAITSHVN